MTANCVTLSTPTSDNSTIFACFLLTLYAGSRLDSLNITPVEQTSGFLGWKADTYCGLHMSGNKELF